MGIDYTDSPPEDRIPSCPRCGLPMEWEQHDSWWVCRNDPSAKDAASGDYAERKDGTLECLGRLDPDDYDGPSYDEMCSGEDR